MAWWGICGMQGWRTTMEDTHIATEINIGKQKQLLFAVFDGHGG